MQGSEPQVSQTLLGLLEHYSPTGSESSAVEWLVGRMRQLGYAQAHIDGAGNAVGVMGAGPRQGMLIGHIDTVRGQIPVRSEGDALYGRGAVDAKGPLAAFVDAVADIGPLSEWQWIVVGAVDEEGDSRGARYLIDRHRPAFAIVGEPSRWDRVTIGYKGSAWTRVTVRRPVAHAASPEASACEIAVDFWRDVQAWSADFNSDRGRAFDQVTPSLRGWSSGDDGLEAWATLHLGTRLPPTLTPDDWHAMLRGLGPDADVKPDGLATPAYRGEKNSPLMRAFLGAIRQAGGVPAFVVKTGTADLNLVAPAWSCPAVAYGPGDSSLDHTPDEHILMSEYARARGVLVRVLRTMAA
ncbi:MAG TPA: [LysW]-lysine hydrolase [Anaerolineales bacterium]|nr:[LysW]-lysine hydrolase [Anaerolineales bacterium]